MSVFTVVRDKNYKLDLSKNHLTKHHRKFSQEKLKNRSYQFIITEYKYYIESFIEALKRNNYRVRVKLNNSIISSYFDDKCVYIAREYTVEDQFKNIIFSATGNITNVSSLWITQDKDNDIFFSLAKIAKRLFPILTGPLDQTKQRHKCKCTFKNTVFYKRHMDGVCYEYFGEVHRNNF